VRVEPGDWIVGDDGGVMVVPRARAAETANHAMAVLEYENRQREEIGRDKTTLGKMEHLQRWEKTRG